MSQWKCAELSHGSGRFDHRQKGDGVTEECANTETKRTGEGAAKWQVICPVCGVLDTGATLRAVIETEYAHRNAAEVLREYPPAVRFGLITRDGIRFD